MLERLTHGTVFNSGVVLGNPDDQASDDKTDKSAIHQVATGEGDFVGIEAIIHAKPEPNDQVQAQWLKVPLWQQSLCKAHP